LRQNRSSKFGTRQPIPFSFGGNQSNFHLPARVKLRISQTCDLTFLLSRQRPGCARPSRLSYFDRLIHLCSAFSLAKFAPFIFFLLSPSQCIHSELIDQIPRCPFEVRLSFAQNGIHILRWKQWIVVTHRSFEGRIAECPSRRSGNFPVDGARHLFHPSEPPQSDRHSRSSCHQMSPNP
jgi:hypothetical protein